LSFAIAVKLLLISLSESCGTAALLLPLLAEEPDDELPLLPHAAMTRAALAAHAVSATVLVTERNWTTSLWGGTNRSICGAGRISRAYGPPIYLGKQ
jgi:hypothetical protein